MKTYAVLVLQQIVHVYIVLCIVVCVLSCVSCSDVLAARRCFSV